MKFFGTTPNLIKPGAPFYGSGNLRARRVGAPYWWFMMLYSKGGFPFNDDGEPDIDNDIGVEATEDYLGSKDASPPEVTGWGSAQMIPFFVNGHIFSTTHWDGSIPATQSAKSPTRGKWIWGPAPGSIRKDGTLVKRSICASMGCFILNRHSKKSEAAYWLCQYLSSPENSTKLVGDPENSWHDPWHPSHFKDPAVLKAYTPAGIKAIQQNFQITSVALSVTGGPLQLFDHLDKNLAEAILGKHNAKQVVKNTSDAWNRAIRKIGRRTIKADLQSYKDTISKLNVPTIT